MKYSLALLLLLPAAIFGQEVPVLSLTTRLALPNVDGRIDHFSADVKGKRLFLSALGNRTLEVLDVSSGQHLKTLADLADPQGTHYDPGTNRLFVASAKDGTAKLFDAESYQLLDTVTFSSNADNVRYDARSQRVLVGYGSGALAILDLKGKKMGEILLDAHPESFQLEKIGTRVFVNVPNQKEIQVADLANGSLLAKWQLTSSAKNFPMALDEGHHRLLIGCRAPARMLAFDTETGKETASVETVGDTDDLFYDEARRRVYVIGGEGFVDVFAQKDADRYERIGRYPTAPGAHTGLFVPGWSKLFVAVPHRGEQRAEVIVFEAK
jgi:DNA-binding beta-propeller fold protein YncE